MQAKDHARTTRRITTLVIAVSTIFASIALAADPGPPSCLTADGSPPDPTGNCCESTPTAYADENGPLGNGTVIGGLLPRSDTFHSIGFVWDIDGDADHDGSVSARYRKLGACNFAPAMPLIRNDYVWYFNGGQASEPTNNFAGSLMFLTPGTTYEVVLELTDPDGGRAIRVQELTTRAIPRKPTAGRTLHVVPGNGGGDGSSGNPFRGINTADAAAVPGDTMLLHAGTYAGTSRVNSSGIAQNYIVWEPAGDGTPIIEALEFTGSYIWFDQLTFTRNANDIGISVPWAETPHSPNGIVITNSSFTGYHDSVLGTRSTGTGWTIMDNTIVGDKPEGGWTDSQTSGSNSGAGITLNRYGGHVVAYNSISRVGDGLNAKENSDVYGNDIFDLTDDNIEADGSEGNVRIWGNRMHQTATYNASFQPQRSGPWYFLYNQMAQARYQAFKWHSQDRLVFINNTILSGVGNAQVFMKTVMRNNLFIRVDGNGPVWRAKDPGPDRPGMLPQFLPDWNTDVDYDGFDWGGTSIAFGWFDPTQYYSDLTSFSAAVGIEQNGLHVDRNLIFEDYVVAPDHSLTLNPSGNAIDAGAYLPNLADFYIGSAPDLGAHERGAAPIHYGPRNSNTQLDEQALYWAKH